MAVRRGFVTATNRFIRSATWLSDADAPAVASLKAMARELDAAEFIPAALMNSYGLAYRSLLRRAPVEDAPVDEFEAALAEGLASE